MTIKIIHGDCLDELRALTWDSIDAIVTDPPYGLGFMGKEWDALPPGREWAEECLRVLKPGGHLLAFGGTRTWHRLAVAIEDAGFELRDSIAWLYGSGFPKSMDVSKAIDKAAGATREVVGERPWTNAKLDAGQGVSGLRQAGGFAGGYESERVSVPVTAPATPEAEQWQGWGTALKPAFEPIVVARKPLRGTVAANVLAHGTGALNIDGCRIEGDVPTTTRGGHTEKHQVNDSHPDARNLGRLRPMGRVEGNPNGRWPANVIMDDGQAAALDKQSGERPAGRPQNRFTPGDKFGGTPYGTGLEQRTGWATSPGYTDSGGASRFFYTAKAPKKQRPVADGIAHPTVKPLALMRWLVRLVTPPGGTVLDPFAGSGTTGEAAELEGFHSILIEREADYLPLIRERLERSRSLLDEEED